VAGGKITDYGSGFFRILLNEQLLLVPLFLWLFGKVLASPPFQGGARGGLSRLRIEDPDSQSGPLIETVNTSATPSWLPLGKGEMTMTITTMLLLAILTINITRIYLVALAVGILFLFSAKNWKRWLTYSFGALIFFIMAFTLTHLAATKGKSLGLEYMGLRLQSIAMPQTEDSSLSRLLLLPKIMEKIKLHPLLGNGLGDTVTVYSPVFKANVTTPHFDWGYLEIIAEKGIIGLAAWILVIGYLILKIKKNKAALAALVGLLVINITSPALFHVLGVVLIVLFFSISKTIPLPTSQPTNPMTIGK
jgi:O-antigen ligase